MSIVSTADFECIKGVFKTCGSTPSDDNPACLQSKQLHCTNSELTGDFFGNRYQKSYELYKSYEAEDENLLAEHIETYISKFDPQSYALITTNATIDHARLFVHPDTDLHNSVPLLHLNQNELARKRLFLLENMLQADGAVQWISLTAAQFLIDMPDVVTHIDHLRSFENGVWLPAVDFQVTRHAYSCNNASAGKSFYFKKDGEPSLADIGISSAITLAEGQRDRFSSNFIVVSPLIRTWMTAVLLYGSKQTSDLTLLVAPHLKEHAKLGVIEIGNMPKNVSHQVAKFVNFLNHVTATELFMWCKNVTLLFPVRVGVTAVHVVWKDNEWNVQRTRGDKYAFDDYYGLSFRSRMKSGNLGAWFDSKYMRSDGSLRMFAKWWAKNQIILSKLRPLSISKTIHIVCHSQVMKTFCSTCKNTKQNMWSLRFYTNVDGESAKIVLDMPGVNKPSSKTSEKKSENTLCGKLGMVPVGLKKSVSEALHPIP